MPGTFVPFFERPAAGDSLPQYQFNQYKLSKVTLAPPQTVRHVDKGELRAKLLNDLRNAFALSLPQEAIQQIVLDLRRHRFSTRPALQNFDGDAESEISEAPQDTSDKPIIRLEKEGDKITHIVVECECGQEITLDCIY
ncbi:MAG: hypothetical protein HY735_12260 [Verrucomicrobia bacterium]|nr:hypothetical protein [Verrucomicrobiota bacterium]